VTAGAHHEVVTTRSGARAIRDLATGELMHPTVGPLVEAEELYVAPARLAQRLAGESDSSLGGSSPPLVVLDVGLGAGSNAIAAWKRSEHATARSRRLEIVSFDCTPSAMELALADENPASFGFEPGAVAAARELLAKGASRTARTSWRLVLGDLLVTLRGEPAAEADVVFWDPFSPRANPSLWTVGAFAEVRRLCRAGATLHTYSAATATRSALLLAGFAVGVGSATGQKEQTTMAALRLSDLDRLLDRRWLDRLRRSSAPFPPDAPAGAFDLIAALPQFAGSESADVCAARARSQASVPRRVG
jgi:queuine tRNA-ribosyltransferase